MPERHAGVLPGKFGQRGAHGIAHLELIGTARTRQRKAHHRFAVEQCNLAAVGVAIVDAGQRVQPCVLAIGQGNREVAQGLRIAHGIERAHALLAAVLLGFAAGAIDLHRRQLLVHRTGGDALCEQGLRVEIDPNLPIHAANAGDGRHPIDAIQGARHIAIDEPRHFIGRHRRRIHRISQQRADDFHFRNHRLLDVLRQVHADARDRILGIVQRFQQVGVDAKFDHRGGLPIHHRGKHALDVVERGHRVFHLARHFGFQLLR